MSFLKRYRIFRNCLLVITSQQLAGKALVEVIELDELEVWRFDLQDNFDLKVLDGDIDLHLNIAGNKINRNN